MNRRRTVLLLAIIAMPVMAGGDRIPAVGTESPAFAAGQVLTLDASGKFSQRAPHASDLRAALGEALSTSSEGLVEEKSPVKGGGVMVNLQGRFQNAMTLTVDQDGNVATPCITGSAREADGEVE